MILSSEESGGWDWAQKTSEGGCEVPFIFRPPRVTYDGRYRDGGDE
jgi:arylsulfatase A-like enzyme